MITAGGPYQTNPAMVEKMRDLAAVLNRVSKLNADTRWLSEVKFQSDAAQYASPPMHNRPKERVDRSRDIIPAEQSVSPTITGLRHRNQKQPHRMRTPGSTGAGMGGIRAPGANVGAHITP